MEKTSLQKQAKLRTFRELSRQIGLKLTHQRLELLDVLSSMSDHPSAEDVFDKVKKRIPTIAFDTVYRTLSLFERHGLISRVNYLDGRTRYDSVTEEHCHLICTRCRKIVDFYWPEVDRLQVPRGAKNWGNVKNKYLELRGLCQGCLTKDTKTKVSIHPNRNKEDIS